MYSTGSINPPAVHNTSRLVQPLVTPHFEISSVCVGGGGGGGGGALPM